MKIGRPVQFIAAGCLLALISQGPGRQSPPPRSDRPSGPVAPDSCAECHAAVITHDALHGPVAVGACDACHQVKSVEQHTYTLARSGTDLCLFCHDVDLRGRPSCTRRSPRAATASGATIRTAGRTPRS